MNITLFGAGYVGLTAAVCFADRGHKVLCVETDRRRLAMLRGGVSPVHEAGMQEHLRQSLQARRLAFTDDCGMGVQFGDMLFIAVGTPAAEDGSADLRDVMAVAESIGRFMEEHKTVVVKSTVPVGTAQRVQQRIANLLARRRQALTFDVCSNPEFMREGSAIEDFLRGPRIVVGAESDRVRERMQALYAHFEKGAERMLFMDPRSAELTKYASNAMLASRISFMNEIACLAERLGADVEEVRRGMGADPRIGPAFLKAGCGYGGSCFPKDVGALRQLAEQTGCAAEMLKAIELVNRRQKQWLFDMLQAALGEQLQGATVAVWGLAFKPGTDDMREAPSRTLIESLWDAGAMVHAYDPAAMPQARRIYGSHPRWLLARSREEALRNADALVICTEWPQFQVVDFEWLALQLKARVVVDGRNLYDPLEVGRHGIRYFSIGRRTRETLTPRAVSRAAAERSIQWAK